MEVSQEPLAGNMLCHTEFMKIVEPISRKDVDTKFKLAVVKRSCLVLVTKEWCYWRIASEKEVEAKRVKPGSVDMGGTWDLVDKTT